MTTTTSTALADPESAGLELLVQAAEDRPAAPRLSEPEYNANAYSPRFVTEHISVHSGVAVIKRNRPASSITCQLGNL